MGCRSMVYGRIPGKMWFAIGYTYLSNSRRIKFDGLPRITWEIIYKNIASYWEPELFLLTGLCSDIHPGIEVTVKMECVWQGTEDLCSIQQGT